MCGRPAIVLVAVLAATLAACGGEPDGPLRNWRIEAPYLPPPDPATRARPVPAARPAPATPPADLQPAAPPADERSGAPSDAQVRRDLEEAFGTRADEAVDAASLTRDGLATTPPSAPRALRRLIRAANEVARKPYVYGGGHGRLADETWIDTAYDCSGSISFALAAAGFIDAPMNSTALASFGRPGPGRWVSIYANAGHAFMTVAGLRFDTSGRRERGTRWQRESRPLGGFTVRHPPGL